MAWTAPRTWVSSEVPTAAIMNAHIRDNLLVQDSSAAQLPSDIIYAGGANNMTERVPITVVQGLEGAHLVSTGTIIEWKGRSPTIGQIYAADGGTYQTGVTAFNDLSALDYTSGGQGAGVMVQLITGTQALVMYGARYCGHQTLGLNAQLSYRISGGSSFDASTAWGTVQESDPAGTLRSVFRAHYHTGLTAGFNSFILVLAASGTSLNALCGGPWLLVKPL